MPLDSCRSSVHAIAIGVGLMLFATQPASAACFELIGCTDDHVFAASDLRQLSCDALWTVRNTIFDENGYCFQTAKGKAVFSNAGCLYMTSAAVPLNSYEQKNVDLIRQIERQKGCG